MNTGKQWKLLLLSALIVCGLTGSAIADQSGDFTYTDNGADITITGYTGSGGAVTIPDTIIAKQVIGIGAGAFASKGLTSVTIPAGVTGIGDNAFKSNTGLTRAVFLEDDAPDMGATVFDSCDAGFTVYYIDGATGFDSPWNGYTTAPTSDLSFNVTFDLAGKGTRTGGGDLSQTIVSGEAATEPTFTANTGWIFTGWDKAFDNITADTTVTAHYLSSCVVGLAYEMPLPDAFSAAANVVVKGLPAGLKYNAVTRKITGVPTKAGVFSSVIISATGVPSQTITITVDSLPAWAQGSFRGSFGGGTDYGVLSADITALGKITGKFSASGKSYTFSAASYASCDEECAFWFTVNAKAGTTIQPLTFKVSLPDGANPPNLSIADVWFAEVADGDPAAKMYRSVWKDADTAAMLAPYIGYYTAVMASDGDYGSGYLSFTVDIAGGVKTTGKLADGTAVSLSGPLLLEETGRFFAIIYSSPTAYKGGCVYGLVQFVDPGSDGKVYLSLLDDLPFYWENPTPESTMDYDTGFLREPGLSGGWYSKLINLKDYYESGLTVGDLLTPDTLPVKVRYIDFDPDSMADNPPAISWTEDADADNAGYSPSGIALTVTDDGTALLAPKAQAPTKQFDPDTKEFMGYNYDELDNPTGLTFSCTRATGLFKGSFNVFFDYSSVVNNITGIETSTHAVKKVSYEGMLIPERKKDPDDGIGGRGFYLWPGKGTYDSGKVDCNGDPVMTSFSFKYSYDFILNE